MLLFKYKELIKLLFSLILNLLIFINMKYYGSKRKYTKTKAKSENKNRGKKRINTGFTLLQGNNQSEFSSLIHSGGP